MKAAEITDRLIPELVSGRFRHARLNYANGDMVGHTGNTDASIVAMEAVDIQIGRLLRTISELEGALIVTADHGNCDEMVEHDETGAAKRDEQGRPVVKTSHSLNRVPFYVYAPAAKLRLAEGVPEAGLANLAGTVLQLLGFATPEDYAASLLAD
jgi:2,3-bisphosphoglycerate-independent phosphoglycerate mutase